jgi:hypothetical protein
MNKGNTNKIGNNRSIPLQSKMRTCFGAVLAR